MSDPNKKYTRPVKIKEIFFAIVLGLSLFFGGTAIIKHIIMSY